MPFWIVAACLAAAAGALLLRALFRAGREGSANSDIAVYRTQLEGVERDLARGVIEAGEAERTRIEISRRILEADRSGAATEATRRGSPLVPLLATGVALSGAFALYLKIGAPGYPDLPIAKRIERAEAFRATRPSQAEAEAAGQSESPRPEPDAAYLELMERLRAAVAEHPDDLTGQRLLARNEANLGNYAAAAAAQARVVALADAKATAQDFAALADNYILAADGYVSPEAEAALAETLVRDPRNPTARFYMGLMWAQTGRPDRAFQLWRALLEEGPEEAPWIPPIRADIIMLAEAAGVDYTPPAPAGSAPGPDAGDIAAASEMDADERTEMIRGMVDGLADRLATEGGPAEDWARLISSLAVLGETERATAIWSEAQSVFADREAELATVRAAATGAGIAE
ncbi:hypothetical protein DEA8626_01081 [Defluviimonas aquaemixtae]|uniref:Cytochrome c-type biogenesis protein CcmH n=1 Tax=Albidovulum aquaemixtae TaxID=1542388 RepID=A0A2R8B4L4_9RHOB|nr:c-type cytochrome biogenesis protein CcmI [Defluviimonas aquaemixtae]SPH17558.1 hypothetical protein DEA8626_01081 [Defluviimonas aquaemixtae]